MPKLHNHVYDAFGVLRHLYLTLVNSRQDLRDKCKDGGGLTSSLSQLIGSFAFPILSDHGIDFFFSRRLFPFLLFYSKLTIFTHLFIPDSFPSQSWFLDYFVYPTEIVRYLWSQRSLFRRTMVVSSRMHQRCNPRQHRLLAGQPPQSRRRT